MIGTAAIIGIGGPILTHDERTLLDQHRPAGVILFGRNIQEPTQLHRLTATIRECLSPDAVLMVDQEGGRVARLRPPHWKRHPPAGVIGALVDARPEAAARAAWLHGALIGLQCAAEGFDTVCAPVMDLRLDGRDQVVGDRGWHVDPEITAMLGRAMADGLLAAGMQPVMKHLPGHGRARVDSHLALPVVDDAEAADLVPFTRNADLGWAMTAHVLNPAWDTDHPATLSATTIKRIIRGEIDFQGVLVSDDLAMGALAGTPAARVRAALEAGCDLAMYCSGEPEANAALLEACPAPRNAALERLASARAQVAAAVCPLDGALMWAERETLLA